MSRQQYAWVWTAVGLFTCNYAFWSWLNPVLGVESSPVPFVDHRAVCASVTGFVVSGFGLLTMFAIAERHAKQLSARPWQERLPPIPGFVTSPKPTSPDGRLIQALNAAVFLGFPFIAMMHFAYAMLRKGFVYEKVPLPAGGNEWQLIGDPFVGLTGDPSVAISFWDDRYRIGNVDSSEAVTWAPILQPILMIALFVAIAFLLVRFFAKKPG